MSYFIQILFFNFINQFIYLLKIENLICEQIIEKEFFLDFYPSNGVSPDSQFSPNLVGRWILSQGLKGRLESRWWALFLELQPKGRLKKWNYRAAQDRQTPFGSVNQKNSSLLLFPPSERKKEKNEGPFALISSKHPMRRIWISNFF